MALAVSHCGLNESFGWRGVNQATGKEGKLFLTLPTQDSQDGFYMFLHFRHSLLHSTQIEISASWHTEKPPQSTMYLERHL